MDLVGALLDRGQLLIGENWLLLAILLVALLLSRGRELRSKKFLAGTLPFLPSGRRAVLLVVAVSLTASLTKAARDGVALPQYHDDYAYLVAADTFAQGHLSYPTHPFAEHFETMHVLQRPRYVSKFPPGQGLLLAAGTLAGQPLLGVWLMTAAACAAFWWALCPWTGQQLAVLGALLSAVHPTMLEWSQVYHGGTLAALAGALLLGAAGRFRGDGGRQAGWAPAVVAGVALGLLAVSRPYEGLVFAAGMFAAVPSRYWIRVLPVAILALVPLAIYNRAITGSPLTLPYSLYERQYDPVPNFLWERPRPIFTWPNAEMAFQYQKVYASYYRREMAPGGLADALAKKVYVIQITLFGGRTWLPSAWGVLLLPLVALPRALGRRREARVLAVALGVFALAPFSIVWWLQMHYLAPAAALAVALMMMLLVELRSMHGGGLLATAVVVVFVINALGAWRELKPTGDFERQRRALAASLPGRNVIFVGSSVFDAVYNGGDIDAQRVVWARDLGAARNRALAEYYHDRRAWLLTREGLRLHVIPSENEGSVAGWAASSSTAMLSTSRLARAFRGRP